jgi:hypothetical protein
MPDAPSRNDDLALSEHRIACPVCRHGFRPVGRRRFCSDACRQAAWRARHPATPVVQLPSRWPRPATVYECPACEARFLGEQRCPDCGIFCRRVGPGAPCPHCDEPVAIGDLLPTQNGGATR